MATILHRGFMRRSLPALLALLLGLLVASQPISAVVETPAGTAAADLSATAFRSVADEPVHTGHSAPAATPPAESAAPPAIRDDATEQIPAGAHLLRTQATARLLGSRAPPSAIA